ncbi:SGNH/GDSL hydrolase family protein [Anaerosporobacter sp.]
MNYVVNKENAIANRGNCSRIKKVLRKAARQEVVTIGFIGGSITQGSLSSSSTTCYAYRVFEWWKNTFPDTAFTYINAGIGGTTSQFGASRVEEDLLVKDPDFVIVEFSVNDDSNEHFRETYEGLIRKIYSYKTKPAVLIVHNVYYDSGANAQVQHAMIARHYNIPSVSMQSSIYPEVVAGHINNRDITPDDLHPNDAGHELVAAVVTYFLDKINEERDIGEDGNETLLSPITKNEYENSIRYRNNNITWTGTGFEVDQSVQSHITDCFKNGWTAEHVGDYIVFEIEASSIAVQYRKSVKQPAPIARVVIDGDEENSVLLDANFEETWGDKLELTTVLEHGEYKKHRVEVRVVEVKETNIVPFYLVSVIGGSR